MKTEPETSRLERKKSISNFRDVSECVCAFANDQGGRLVIGLDDAGKAVGVPVETLDEFQRRLGGAVQVVHPTPVHSIEVQDVGEQKIVIIEVQKMGLNAFCTVGGIVYVRQGSSNVKLEGHQLKSFLVKRRILTFDRMESKAKLDDIDPAKVQDFLQKTNPKIVFEPEHLKKILLNLDVADEDGRLAIRNAALLFFAKDPHAFMPQAEIKLVRFKGVIPVDVIDSQVAQGTMLDNIETAQAFIRRNTSTEYRVEKLQREEIPEYPDVVTREVVINAAVHRDYLEDGSIQVSIFDDRMEVSNPGGLPEGILLSDIGGLSFPRNPITYRLMRELRYIESMGTGIARMREGMRKAGLPEPKFEQIGPFFKVTIFAKPADPKTLKLSDRQKKALVYLMEQGKINSRAYCKLNRVSLPTSVADLNEMVKLGLVKRIGKTRGAHYVLKKEF